MIPSALFLAGALSIKLYLNHQARLADERAKAALRLVEQQKQAAIKKRHDLLLERIRSIKDKGVTLPTCPLVFPLLDAKGKVTPLGTYLSYLSMKVATYLPEEVYCLPNPGESFESFGLFDAVKTDHGPYLNQLPYRQLTHQTASGTLTKNHKGYKIKLKFSGHSKTKKFEKTFKKGQLYLAPAWMASCLQDWTGFHPTDGQKAYMAKPIFTTEKDLIRASRLEWIVRGGGAKLVNRWDEFLDKKSDDPILVDHWVAIEEARDKSWAHQNLMALYKPLMAQNPNAAFFKGSFALHLQSAGGFDEALDLLLDLLLKDDNNPDFYQFASWTLERKEDLEACNELFKVWTSKHPDNARAWLEWSDAMNWFAWHIRGGDFADNVPEENMRKFQERMREGFLYAQKAVQLEPGNAKVWDALLSYGNGLQFERSRMDDYLARALRCDTNDLEACNDYLWCVEPIWSGSAAEMVAFAEKHKKKFPQLFYYTFSFLHKYDEDKYNGDWNKWHDALKEFINEDPSTWKELVLAYETQLERHPAEMTTWADYLDWMSQNAEEQRVLDYAKKMSELDPELESLYPYMAIDVTNIKVNRMRLTKPSPEDIENILSAYGPLLKQDPHNWNIWNRMARYSYLNSRPEVARKAFDGLGDHWDEAVWDRATFDKAKANVMPPPATPTVK